MKWYLRPPRGALRGGGRYRYGDVLKRQTAGRNRSGIRTNVVRDALKAGVGILVVGRAITVSKDVSHAADEFTGQINKEEIE